MSTTKSKSGLSETPNKKTSPATPRVSKLNKGVVKPDTNSPSPLQKPRSLIGSPQSVGSKVSTPQSVGSKVSTPQSVGSKVSTPQSVSSKPSTPQSVSSKTSVVDRRSPRPATPSDKTQPKVAKGSDIQARLIVVQEDLKKAKEQIDSIEKEKAQAIDELKEAQRVAEEANEKLREALVAQKRAEESSEIEKFRAVELEQAGIDAAQKKDDEWQTEVEAVRNQHALDVASLLSTTQELQRVKQELATSIDAKNQALSHADDAAKVAEMHAEKVETLSAELIRMKSMLESKLETESKENSKLVLELTSEVDYLNQELEKAKAFEEKLKEKDVLVEQLNVDLEAARMAESYARSLAEEWKNRVEELELQAEEAKKLERSASESLESVMKQLERSNDMLDTSESEIDALKEKVGLLEMTIKRQRTDLQESEHRIETAKLEISDITKVAESLKTELERVKEDKIQALNNEKLAASNVQSLLEEKNKLIDELDNSRDEEEKSKKAMESLASALHEVSAEAREAKEQLLSIQAGHENYEDQIEDLKLVLKATNEKYETLLNEAKHETDLLLNTIDQTKSDFERSRYDWEDKEQHLANCVKQSEEEKISMKKEIDRLVSLLRRAEEEVAATKEEGDELKDNLKEVESEVITLQETLSATNVESMNLKEILLDRERELQTVIQENKELQTRETMALEKAEELSKLLEEAMTQKPAEENGNLTDSEKDYDMLPKVVEFSEENGHAIEDKSQLDIPPQHPEEPRKENSLKEHSTFSKDTVQTSVPKPEHVNGVPKDEGSKESKEKEDDSVEVEFKMWESCKIEKKELSPGREPEEESQEEEADTKAEDQESFDQINALPTTENNENGKVSPSKQEHSKKKKPLFRKFGSLLKKKSPNQK